MKLVLAGEPGGQRLRLHYWFAESGDGDREDIHTHRWPMRSIVLIGCFTDVEFTVSPGGDDVVGQYDKADPAHQLRAVWPATIAEGPATLLHRGCEVEREPGHYHRFTCVGPGPGMTLVSTGPPETTSSLVARFRGSELDVDPGQPVAVDTVRMILRCLVELDPPVSQHIDGARGPGSIAQPDVGGG